MYTQIITNERELNVYFILGTHKVQINLIHEFFKCIKETSHQDIKVLTVGLIDFGSSVKTFILIHEMI